MPRGAPWVVAGLAGAMLVMGATIGASTTVSLIAGALELIFVVFFARHFAFALSAMRTAPADLRAPMMPSDFAPSVSVLVAGRNEEAVIEGLAASLLALDYPAELLQIVIVDDGSSDRTGAILDDLARATPRLSVLHRAPDAGGGKSGALNEALSIATGEIVVVFDADHQPRRDVVRRLVRHFVDPGVGAVQGRCVIRNERDSLLSSLIAVDYLAGYLVNEYGRQSLFRLPAYGGANCAVRASSLRALGGWNTASVTEDTDLTMRLILRGQRVRYDVGAVDEEEGVVTLDRYWRQRYRWARGHQQVWRDYRGAVWGSARLSITEKIETTLFLLVFHVPIASALGLVVLASWFGGVVHPADPLHSFLLWTLLFLGPLLELGGGLLIAGADRRTARRLVWFLPMFFVSAALCTKAWIDGVMGRPYSWVKTERAADGSPA